MNLIEMDGFLRGKCLPGDMKVNETNAEYLVRKLAALEQRLTESQRELRSADVTIENMQMLINQEREAKLALAAENAGLKAAAEFATAPDMWVEQADGMLDYRYCEWYVDVLNSAIETPATDAFLAEVRASGIDAWISSRDGRWNGTTAEAERFAAKLRKGGQS